MRSRASFYRERIRTPPSAGALALAPGIASPASCAPAHGAESNEARSGHREMGHAGSKQLTITFLLVSILLLATVLAPWSGRASAQEGTGGDATAATSPADGTSEAAGEGASSPQGGFG
jgi:hypothetical protein